MVLQARKVSEAFEKQALVALKQASVCICRTTRINAISNESSLKSKAWITITTTHITKVA